MTPEAQQIAIAEVCGLINQGKAKGVPALNHKWYRMVGSKPVQVELPDYLNDLNAIRGAVKALFDSNPGYYERSFFFNLLLVSTGYDAIEHGWNGDAELCCKACCASASEYAKALLLTIGKWVEE